MGMVRKGEEKERRNNSFLIKHRCNTLCINDCRMGTDAIVDGAWGLLQNITNL